MGFGDTLHGSRLNRYESGAFGRQRFENGPALVQLVPGAKKAAAARAGRQTENSAMKVVLSWSGNASRSVANLLHSWLPEVIQVLEPWMSEEDIHKGTTWFFELSKALDTAQACIVCVTPENISSTWLHYEAGAVTSAFGKTRVCPYLFRLRKEDISGPMAHLQLASANREDTLRLLHTLNGHLGAVALTPARLTSAFERCWPELERKLKSIPVPTVAASAATRSEEEVLGEVLETVRRVERAYATEGERVEQILKLVEESHRMGRARPVDPERVGRTVTVSEESAPEPRRSVPLRRTERLDEGYEVCSYCGFGTDGDGRFAHSSTCPTLTSH